MNLKVSNKKILIGILILIGLGIISSWFQTYLKSHDSFLVEEISERVQKELSVIDDDLNHFVEDYATSSLLFDHATTYKYPIYVFDKGSVKYWSDHRFIPEYADLTKIDSIGYIELSHGKFIALKRHVPYSNQQLEIFTLLDLYKQYPIDNKYLHSSFNKSIFPGEQTDLILSAEKGEHPISFRGKYLFNVATKANYNFVPEFIKWITVISYAIATLLLILVVIKQGNNQVKKGNFVVALFFVFGTILLLRVIMIWLQYPFSMVNASVFNPINFTSGGINTSLGDLVLNQISILIIVLFGLHSLRYSYAFKKWLITRSNLVWSISLIAYTLLSLASGRYIYKNLRDILINSQINLDITSDIHFDALRIVVLFSFLITTLIFFAFQYFNLKLLIKTYKRSPLLLVINAVVASGIFYFIFLTDYLLFLGLIFAFWLASSQLKNILNLGKRRYSAFLYFFMTASVASVFGSYAVFEQVKKDTENEKRKFANNLLIERDILGEYLLSQVLPKIQEDSYIQTRMYSERLAENTIEDKINRSYLIDYFDKYQAKVHIFDRNGDPFSFNELQITIDSAQSVIRVPKNRTDYDDIFYVDQPELQDRYFAYVEMKSLGNVLGTILLELTLKNYVSSSVYPELLVENKYSGATSSKFDYAIFENNEEVYHVGNYNFSRDFNKEFLNDPKLFDTGITWKRNHHLGVEGMKGRTIVITSRKYQNSNVLSNFSFFFFVQIIGIAIILVTSNIFFVYPRPELNFSTKISFYLGTAFLIPLFIVSIAILNSLSRSYREEINRSYEKRARRIEEHVNEDVTAYFDHKINKEALSSRLSNITVLVQNDVNIYDKNGALVASSQPKIFTSGLLSECINPEAIFEIKENGRERMVLDESIGSLGYKSFYIAIQSRETNEMLGILSMPFFESKNHLKRQQIEVVDNLINIFILILIVSLIISYFAVRILTEPLNLLTAKIRKTSLSDLNQPLEYQANDEIGLLVEEYNQMLKKLEESKRALAQTEKESAWKEIAKQVAHEIKNPLTPMKLTLQQMQRVMGKDDKSQRTVENLLHQVDTLSDIATSFSTFAKMPVPEHDPFDIAKELRNSIMLFENENGNIESDLETGEFFVDGDAKLTGRIFNNLLINAFQSVPEGREPILKVKFGRKGNNKVLISIQDNGAGIPEELHSKIFIPNFSTKDTGSGIGLAIAKRGIEHAQGDLWFETSEDGTTFYIELPLV